MKLKLTLSRTAHHKAEVVDHEARHPRETTVDCVACNPTSASGREFFSPMPPITEPAVRTMEWSDSMLKQGSAILSRSASPYSGNINITGGI